MVAPLASKDGSRNTKDEKGSPKHAAAAEAVATAPRVPAGPGATPAAASATNRPAVTAAIAAVTSGTASEKASMSKSTVEAKSPASRESSNETKARLKAIEQAMGQIEKAYGKGSIMRLDSDAVPVIQGVSTGALSLDLALGGRGLPKGRVVEVFGPESSGKTTLALTVIANAQKKGGIAAFIDAEHALDP